MPGPALHHMIADKLKARISQNEGLGDNATAAQYAALQNLLADPKNLPYLFLGCQGPDYLFFNTKDMPGPTGAIAKLYFEVGDFIEEFKRTLLAAVPQPVLDALAAFDEAANEVIEDSVLLSELQQTFEDLSRLMDGFSATLMEAVKKFITEFNVFEMVSHPYRDGAEPEKWWWFDALHYRKTGKFAQALLDATSSDLNDPKILYALGYLTHYCADTVGHPYVNLVSGGPYRSHAQRHKTGENYQDVFNMKNETGADWNRSKLHALYNFNFSGTIDTENNEPDSFTNLPDDLAEMIAKTMNTVFQEDTDVTPEYGPEISADDVNNAYRLYYKWLKNATETGTLPLPVAYSFSAEMREVWEKTMDNLGDVGDFLENAFDEAGDWGILSIFIALGALIVGAVMAAAALADGIAGAITTLGTATIRAAACLIYDQIYNAYQNFRLGVAMNGLAFPMQEHLNDPRLTQFANPANADPTGVNGIAVAPFLPLLKFIPDGLSQSVFHQERHLVYPTTQPEKDQVMGMLSSYLTQASTHYAFGDIPFRPEDLLDKLENLTPDPDPKNNDDGQKLAQLFGKSRFGNASLGNAMTLIEKSHQRFQEKKNLIDFNLDGDRGYGYLCWTQNRITPEPPEKPDQLKVNNPTDTDPTNDNVRVQLNFLK
ncbi:zinc dependent phospholipase C family protein [Pedobacter nyackensis]|uniref:zinc dependent phospholipase C family protein n=1 Tax=Pedobacter nyackensis TaxID=475255 RepID=UPI002931426C|nr:zinc dependent phospholipase C family protein [Pedobacter nyackensis]